MVFVFGGCFYNDVIVDYVFIIFFSFNKIVVRINVIVKFIVFIVLEVLRLVCC